VQQHFVQGSLLLAEIPETLSETDVQLMAHKVTPNVADYSRSVERDEIGLATHTNDVQTCLRLLYQILYRAVFALTQNQ